MAQSHQAGNPTVTAENPLTDLLAAPLSPDWTIEGLAEQLLCTIASQPKEEAKELLLDSARRDRSTIATCSQTVARLPRDQVGRRSGNASEPLRRPALLQENRSRRPGLDFG